MAFMSGTMGSAFRRYITKSSAFIGPYINASTWNYELDKMLFSTNGLDWDYGVMDKPVSVQGKTPDGLYYGYYNNNFYTSTDRYSWTLVAETFDNYEGAHYPEKIVYGENNNIYVGLFYSIMDNNRYLKFSVDGGISWYSSYPNFTMATDLAYANYGGTDLFIGISMFDNTIYYRSTDGVSWSTLFITNFYTDAILKSVNNKIVAFRNGTSGGYTTTLFQFTTTGYLTSTTPSGRYIDIAYGNGKYILLDYYPPASNDGATITTSSTLTSWSFRSLAGVLLSGAAYAMSWQSIMYGSGRFIVIGNYGDKIITSETGDSNTWSLYPMPEYGSKTYGIAIYWPGDYQV